MAKYYNITFPIKDDVENNRLFAQNKTVRDGVRSELLMLLMTDKGERWMNPDYGTNLKIYLFDPNDDITEEVMKTDIITSVAKFLPRITIANIVFERTDKETEIIINVTFTYNQIYYGGTDSLSVKISA